MHYKLNIAERQLPAQWNTGHLWNKETVKNELMPLCLRAEISCSFMFREISSIQLCYLKSVFIFFGGHFIQVDKIMLAADQISLSPVLWAAPFLQLTMRVGMRSWKYCVEVWQPLDPWATFQKLVKPTATWRTRSCTSCRDPLNLSATH